MKAKVKKFLSVLLTLSLVFGILGITPVEARASQTITIKILAPEWYNGSFTVTLKNGNDIVFTHEVQYDASLIPDCEWQYTTDIDDSYNTAELQWEFSVPNGLSLDDQITQTQTNTFVAGFSCVIQEFDEVPATCTTSGRAAYYYCAGHNVYSTRDAFHEFPTYQITGPDDESLVIPALEHSWSTEWTTSATEHWHICTRNGCNETSDRAEHNWTWRSNGTNHWHECAICGANHGDSAAHNYVNGVCECGAVEAVSQPTVNPTHPTPAAPEPEKPSDVEEPKLPIIPNSNPPKVEDETPSVPQKAINEKNYDSVKNAVNNNKSTGQPYVVKLTEGNSLDLNMMELLEKNPLLTIDYEYVYKGKKYHVLIPGSLVKVNKKIRYYGPLWLYLFYGIAPDGTPVGIAYQYPELLFQLLMM